MGDTMYNEKEYEGLDKKALLTILSESEKLANVGGWEWDLLNDYWTFSNSWLHIHGCTKRHLSTSELLPIAHPDDRAKIQNAFDKAVADGVKYEIEHRIIKQDTGEERYIRACGTVKMDKNGKPVKLYGSALDITDQKLVEDALKKERTLFKTIVDRLPIMITRYDPDVNMLFLNSEFEKKIGWTTREVQNVDMMEKVYPDPEYREQAFKYMQKASKEWKEFNVLSKSGQIIESEWSNIRLEDGTQVGIGMDISVSKTVKKSLIKSESLFRGLYDNMTSGSAIYEVINDGSKGSDYIIKNFNKRSLEIEGKSLDQVIGKSLSDLRPNIDDYGLIPVMKKVWETGVPDNFPIKIYQDEIFSNYYENYIFRIPSGEVVTIYNDVTDHKNAESALRESEERFSLAMEFANDGLFDWNLETNKIYYSPGWKKMLGYEDHEIKNEFSAWERLTNPEDVKKSWEMLNELLKGKRERFETEFKMRHKDGHWVHILSRANVIFDENGKGKRVVGTHVDISEIKRTEKALRESEEQFRHYFEHLTIGIAVYEVVGDGEDFIISDMNITGQQLSKVSIDEIRGKKITHVFPGVKKMGLFKALQETWQYGKTCHIPHQQYEDDRIQLWVENRVFKLPSGKIVAVYEDRTDFIRIEENLHQAQKLEAVGVLAGGIAHDFNNMLGIIYGNVSYLLNCYQNDEELVEVLSDIQEGARKSKQLTQQLLTFAKGGAPIKKAADINFIIQESAKFVTRGANVKCNYDFADNLWVAEVDSGQLNQVISNLVINANQAMPAGGIITIKSENTEIESGSKIPLPNGKYIKIILEDQGIGISENHLQNIFDPYFSTKQEGSGLGLATAYSIIKKHGGHIRVESKIGKGTKFTIYLPVSEKQILKTDENETIKHVNQGRILVMDDEEHILKMTGRMLGEMGYKYHLVLNGDQAIEDYQGSFQSGSPFDMVILDLTIPGGMGGQDVIKKLLEIDPDVKAVVSSGYSNDPVMSNYSDYGFKGIIPKPYSQNQVAAVLNKIFDENV
jgi:PAS domain S-box-containing protein